MARLLKSVSKNQTETGNQSQRQSKGSDASLGPGFIPTLLAVITAWGFIYFVLLAE